MRVWNSAAFEHKGIKTCLAPFWTPFCERLNKEIRRRTNVLGIFPNRLAIIRPVGAVLCEQNDEWCVGRRYMGLSTLAAVPQLTDPPPSLTGKEAALEPIAAQA